MEAKYRNGEIKPRACLTKNNLSFVEIWLEVGLRVLHDINTLSLRIHEYESSNFWTCGITNSLERNLCTDKSRIDSCETQLFSQQVRATKMMNNHDTTMIFDSIAITWKRSNLSFHLFSTMLRLLEKLPVRNHCISIHRKRLSAIGLTFYRLVFREEQQFYWISPFCVHFYHCIHNKIRK
jgi:hypothetical protein